MKYHLFLPDISYKYIAPVHHLPVMLPEITATDMLSYRYYSRRSDDLIISSELQSCIP